MKSIIPDNSVMVVYEWTEEEKQLFDNALAELDPSSPDFYANVAYRIPWKSIDEVKDHYQKLVGDAEKIESQVHEMPPTLEDGQENHQESLVESESEMLQQEEEASPNESAETVQGASAEKIESQVHEMPPTLEDGQENHQESLVESESEMMQQEEEASPDESAETVQGASSDPSPEMENAESCIKPRRRSIPWTEQEHQTFLVGLELFGKGKWKDISKSCVLTKTPAQVASHAQKFFVRLRQTTPFGRRRPSINDTSSYFPSSSEFDSPEVQSEFSPSDGILNNDSNLILPPQGGSPTIQNDAVFSNSNHPCGLPQTHDLSYNGDFTNSGLIPTPQNDFPIVGNEVAFAHPYDAHQGGVQDLNSNQDGNFSSLTQPVDSSLIFPQNLYSVYNLDSAGSNLISPPQSSFPGVGNESAAFTDHHHPDHGGVQNLYLNQNVDQFPSVDNSIINPNPNFPPQNVIPNIEGEISFSQPNLPGSTENSNPYYDQELLDLADLFDPSFIPSGSSSESANAHQPNDANFCLD